MTTISTLENGLTVIVEEIPSLESASYELLLHGGIATDDSSHIGHSLVLTELTSRGAATYDAKGLSDAFENAGIRHGEFCGHDRMYYRGSLLPDKLECAFRLVSAMILTPTFPESELAGIKGLLLQDIRSLKDSPSRWAMLELSSLYYPEPFGRPGMGTEAGVEGATVDSLRKEWERIYHPRGAVLSVAGNVRAEEVLSLVQKYFGLWKGDCITPPSFTSERLSENRHISHDSAQLQIALAYPSARFGDPLYYAAKLANGILSGGMFGRLFIEVREKRGLCYSVYSRHSATKEYGAITAYAGTTPQRAQETLDVLLRELSIVPGSITEEELSRSKANVKASLIIGEESASSRASSNAGEYFMNGAIRSLEEITAAISKVTVREVEEYFARFPAHVCTLVTLGATPLTIQRN